MQVRMTKPWQRLSESEIDALPGQLGVYQVATADETVLVIGYAGGREPFGLRSALASERIRWGDRATSFRVEVNQQYLTRYEELLAVHLADHEELPEGNQGESERRIGRLQVQRLQVQGGGRAK